MNEIRPTADGRDTASLVRRLEDACDRHEAEFAAGLRPSIEGRLAESGMPDDGRLLLELLVIEIAYRRRAGERPTPDEYRARFATHEGAIAAAFASAEGGEGPVPRIPAYSVLEELGRGGMGVVYKARAERPNRLVALKMILAGDLAGPDASARFLAEAEAVAKLQHPQIVQIFRIGDHHGRPFLEMEFIEGGSLADRLDGTPRPALHAARLVESLARAIHHAHLRGIVHRDLKPANILIGRDGAPKVTDFGLAKSLGDAGGLTRTDAILGSPSYMAPEQARGATRHVGPATDVYALGAILYEILTGRPPFRAATILETLEHVRTAEPPAPSRIQPGMPIDVETIVMKCLHKEPARRYPSAEELADDLARFLGGRPVHARPLGVVGRWAKWARRRPLAASLACVSVGSLLLLILVLANSNVAILREQRAVRESLERERQVRLELAEANRQLAQQQRLTQKALERKTQALEEMDVDLRRERQASYFRQVALADEARRAGLGDRADQFLDACPADLRGWEWRYLKRPDARPRAFLGHSGEVWDAAISPDGRTLASASFDLTLRTWDAATGRALRTFRGHTGRVYSVAFDPAGTRLVSAAADRTVIVWDLATGGRLLTLRGHVDNVRCAAFSPDGRWICSGSWDGTLRVWSAATGQPHRTCSTGAGWITRLAFSPDGGRVVVGGTSGRAEVWDYLSGQVRESFRGHPDPILGVSFSPDGLRVASTSNRENRGVIKVWEAAGGREVLSVEEPAGPIERVAFSPDGQRLAISGWDGSVRLRDVLTGRDALVLKGHGDRVWGVAFDRTGDAIVSAGADGKVLLWEATRPKDPAP